MKPDDKPRLHVEFDGVIHDGREDPQRPTPILGKPVDGAFEFLTQARELFDIRILSWRYAAGDNQLTNRSAVRRWFKRHGWPTKVGGALESLALGPEEKVVPLLTLSARVSLFEGTFPDPHQLTKFEPYSEKTVHAINR